MSKTKQVDPIPDEFHSYEDAGEFWDTHDTTDYPGIFRSVQAGPRPGQTRARLTRYGTPIQSGRSTKTVPQGGRGRQGVAQRLWHCIDKLDYSLYFEHVATAPRASRRRRRHPDLGKQVRATLAYVS